MRFLLSVLQLSKTKQDEAVLARMWNWNVSGLIGRRVRACVEMSIAR